MESKTKMLSSCGGKTSAVIDRWDKKKTLENTVIFVNGDSDY